MDMQEKKDYWLERAARAENQRDQLREALEELADEYQYNVDKGKPWQRARAALKATEE